MQRRRFRNKFFNFLQMKTGVFIQNNVIYMYQFYEKKKQYFAKLNGKDITNNRKFWHTAKPFLF